MDDAFKTLFLEAVDEIYIADKKQKFTGYMNYTTRELITHLLTNYGIISPEDLSKNQKQMEEPFDPSLPITAYYKRIEDSMQVADDGNAPFSNEQVLNQAYLEIFSTQLYNDPCKVWRRKIEADPKVKTWDNFKTFFTIEYRDLKEQERVIASIGGFHSENNAMGKYPPPVTETPEISGALLHLAMVATTDREIVSQLVETNKTLTTNNEALVEQVKVISTAYKTLASHVNKYNSRDWDPEGYLWSHGFRVGKSHNSKNCGSKCPGHKDAATRSNNMGGSQMHKNWRFHESTST